MEEREASERKASLVLREKEQAKEKEEKEKEIVKEVTIMTPSLNTYTPGTTPSESQSSSKGKAPMATPSLDSYLPTPETNSSDSPSTRQDSYISPPEQAVSPYVTGGSVATSCSAVSRTLSTGSRAPHPTSLSIPANDFVPPPPMCMFFNPSFKDITQGKIGAWKGELQVKGPSGGTFSVLVIGEAGTEDIW
jgi:hypothetical protein